MCGVRVVWVRDTGNRWDVYVPPHRWVRTCVRVCGCERCGEWSESVLLLM